MIQEESLVLLRSQMATKAPTPETMELLKAVWAKLTKPKRLELLQALGSPPDQQDVRAWQGDDELHGSLLRQWRWLAGVANDLEDPWKAAYVSLVQEFGEGDVEPRPYRVMTRMGSSSPLTSVEIADLGPGGFSDWLASWEPQPRGWDVPTPAGLAMELNEAVKSSPEAWMSSLPDLLQGLRHPTYIRGVFEGIRESASDPDFVPNWERIVAALELVVSEPWPVKALTNDSFDSDSDWGNCHMEVMRLLQEALDRDSEFDVDLLERIWSLLLRLMRERGKESGVSGIDDLLTLAINKASTVALRTMFSLTLSVWRREGSLEPWRERLAGAVDEELQAGGIEAQLAGAVAASLFPQFMHISGSKATDLIPALFGAPEPDAFSVGTIETLVKYARPITNEMLLLFYAYLHAYFREEPLDEPDDDERSAIRWLVIGYIRQIDGQQDAASLVELLSHPRRVSEAAEFYGRVLKDAAEPDAAFIEAALRFWDTVLSWPGLDETAFLGFGWWSEGVAIGDDAWLTRIFATLSRTNGKIDWEDEVVQRLIRLRNHASAWEALALLVRGAADRWTLSYWARHLQDLFEESREADEPIQSLRSDLAERLVERELLDFRRYIR